MISHRVVLLLATIALVNLCGCSGGEAAPDASAPIDAGVDAEQRDGGARDDGAADIDAAADAALDDAGEEDAAVEPDAAPTCVPAACAGHVYACGDCLDDDVDGLADSDDPDCLGPCDNTEDSYFTGIPGAAGAPCRQDCYFDQDTGSGSDDCHWSHTCDPLEVAPDYYPESAQGSRCGFDPLTSIAGTPRSCAELAVTQSATCDTVCGPLVPNGCDCFGCCELVAGSGQYAFLGSADASGDGTCAQGAASDPTQCQPCTPVTACLNTCDACEVCIGGRVPEAGCSASAQCADGVAPCGLPGQAECAAGSYCVTGCCQPIPG